MNPQRWQQIDRLFHAALEYEPDQRAAFLSQSCDGDELLREELVSLISSHEEGAFFMEAPASDVAAELLAKDASQLRIGQKIGRYTILSAIGMGGMGRVYLAQDPQLQRQIALKLLPAHFTIDVDHVRRFEQEARAASALNHPNILTIYEIGSSNYTHFIATEFIDGKTLRECLRTKRLSLEEALDIALQVASALSAAHLAGIVHRDIKPENIMLRRDGFVKVLDFGVAKLTFQDEEIIASSSTPSLVETSPGKVMGTVQYMSPEQARGQEVDLRTDIWSLGVVLYEMVTGRVPFTGETRSHLIVSILEAQQSSLTSTRPVPQELECIAEKALRKDKHERYKTADELARDLKNLKQDLELEARSMRSPVSSTGLSGKLTQTERQIRDPDLPSEVPGTSATSRLNVRAVIEQLKVHRIRATIGAAALVLMLSTLAYLLWNKNSKHLVLTDDPINSVAVLPFINTTSDPNTEHLTLGITDNVINKLSRLPKLKVSSLNAVLRYRGKPIDEQKIGRDLKVQAVLITRLTQRGDDLMISTELVDVSRNTRVWSDQFNRKVADILTLQEEIAWKISQGLRLRLNSEDEKRLKKRYTENVEAYLSYSLGRYYFSKNTKEGFQKSLECYEKAINMDSAYALAYAALSMTYHYIQARGFKIPKEALHKQESAAVAAVALDDSLTEAHVALAQVRYIQHDWIACDKESRRALELDPNSFEANFRYAMILAQSGRSEEAIPYAKRADELDETKSRPALGYVYFVGRQYDKAIASYLSVLKDAPNNAQFHFFLGEAYVTKGMFEEGIAELQKAVALDNDPERWDRYPALAYAFAVSGKRQAALNILAEQKRLAQRGYISHFNFAIIYTGLGDRDRAFEHLNKAIDDGMPLAHLPTRPLFDSLRSDPRYSFLIQRTGRAS